MDYGHDTAEFYDYCAACGREMPQRETWRMDQDGDYWCPDCLEAK